VAITARDNTDPLEATAVFSDFQIVSQAGLAIPEPVATPTGFLIKIENNGAAVVDPTTPDSEQTFPRLDIGYSSTSFNFGAELLAYFQPPISADYTFYISSDDNGELWLSTDDQPSNAVKICSVTAWDNYREFLSSAGGSSLTPGPGGKISNPVTLIAGQKYFLHALMKQGPGASHLEVTWWRPGLPPIQPGDVPHTLGLLRFLLPVAGSDTVYTPVNQAVGLSPNVTPGEPVATIDWSTVDLDPATPGRQTSFNLAGAGTFSVDSSGHFTFTPQPGFPARPKRPTLSATISGIFPTQPP
jgi:hypothetical protein